MAGKVIAAAGGVSQLLLYTAAAFTEKPNPRVWVIAAAGGDNTDEVEGAAWMFRRMGSKKVKPLFLFNRTVRDLDDYLSNFDLVWVGGGNTVNLCAILKAQGVQEPLRRFYENGGVLSGISAGALCWFSDGLTDSYGPGIGGSPWNEFHFGLGIVQGYFSPHYDDPNRRMLFRNLLVEQSRKAPEAEIRGWAGDDEIAFVFQDGELDRVVQTGRGAEAFSYTVKDGQLTETSIREVAEIWRPEPRRKATPA
jgi:dipeptidase E